VGGDDATAAKEGAEGGARLRVPIAVPSGARDRGGGDRDAIRNGLALGFSLIDICSAPSSPTNHKHAS
jgi:hypothetical protein